jgi:peptidoglycan/xylan/chitin deacetylase (PgdA/CDA1 family)
VAVTAIDPARPGKHALLTFDDGGASAIHIADILGERGWPAHFFITTEFIGTPGFLGAPEIRALRRAGHVIGSHSATHPLRMGALRHAQLLREWSVSVDVLQDILGEPVTVASIPGGYYTRAVASTAAQAGIRTLFTSEPITRTSSVDGCLLVGRFSIKQGDSPDAVAAFMAPNPLPRARQFLLWNGKKTLKASGGPVWLTVRKSLLAWRAGAEKRRIQHL